MRVISTNDLGNITSGFIKEGYGVIDMFASERHPAENEHVNIILRKGNDVIRIVGDVKDDRYDSVSKDIPSAEIYERLIREYNGFDAIGLKNTCPVTYWRTGDPPLKKERTGVAETRESIPHNNIRGDGIFEIPVGPVHAGVIEPGHFRFSVAGESVIKLNVHLGYTHRGIEKMMEGPVSRIRIHLIERTSGDTTVANSLAYCHIMENGVTVPERAQFIRVIASELERLASHVSVIGGVCTDTAFSVPAALGSRLHEDVLRINLRVFKDRFMRNVIVPGGVRKDIDKESRRFLTRSLLTLKLDIMELSDMMMDSSTLLDRLETTGVLKKEVASLYRAVGPIARASGIASDVRKERPYDAYDKVSLTVQTETSGDVLARTKVRIREAYESIDLIMQCLALMKDGPLRIEIEPSDGFDVSVVESARGELVHCAEIRNGNIWRYSIRDPSLVNWPMMCYAVPGNVVPDFPLINKSFSLSYSGNDL